MTRLPAIALALLLPCAAVAQTYPSPTMENLTVRTGIGLSRSVTAYPVTPALYSTMNVNYAASAGPSHNTYTNSVVYSAGFGHWANLNRITVSSAGIGQNVASYHQALNYAIGGTVNSRELWATVSEVRDTTGLPSSTGSLLLGHEIDVIADGLDDRTVPTVGRQGLVIIAGQQTANPAAPMYVSRGVHINSSDIYSIFKRGFAFGTRFSEAAFTTLGATQETGAHAVWLGTGHRLALNDTGTAFLFSDAVNVNIAPAVMVGSNAGTGVNVNLNAASGSRVVTHTTANVRVWESGMNAAGAWAVGRYTGASVFQDYPISIANSTGDITVVKNLTVSGGSTITASGGAGSVTASNGLARAYRYEVSAGGSGISTSWTGSTSPTGFASVRQTISATGTPTSGLAAFNYLAVSSDQINGDNLSNTANALRIDHNMGGGAAKGGRIGIVYNGLVNGTFGDTPANSPQFTAVASWFTANSNIGGIANTLAASSGVLFGGYDQVILATGATFWRGVNGREIDVSVQTGANAFYKLGLQVVLLSTDNVQASSPDDDQAITIGGQYPQGAAGRGWKTAIGIGRGHGGFSLDTLGTVMEAFRGNSGTMLLDRGIDLNAITFGTAAFRSAGFQVDGVGTVRVGTGLITAVAGGITIDALGKAGLAEAATISGGALLSGGTSAFTILDQFRDAYGGMYQATTVAAGVITQLTVLRRSYATGSPSATVTLTKIAPSIGAGTVQITQTWSALNNITIASATDKLALYGGTPIVKATPVGACAGNTGCQALRDALGNLGAINTGSITN